MRILGVVVGTALTGLATFPTLCGAQVSTCKNIQDNTARLACFDKATGDQTVLRAKPTVSGAVRVTSEQSDYSAKLDRVFLEAGIKLTISAMSDSNMAGFGGKPPYLLIWNGALNRPTIYKLQQKLNIIDEARKVKFKTVIFWEPDGGKYVFDVSKDGPTCSRDLCF